MPYGMFLFYRVIELVYRNIDFIRVTLNQFNELIQLIISTTSASLTQCRSFFRDLAPIDNLFPTFLTTRPLAGGSDYLLQVLIQSDTLNIEQLTIWNDLIRF